MNILPKLKCKIGSHQWTGWDYIEKFQGSIPKSCVMERICNVCKKQERRQGQPHAWQYWTFISDSCEQERFCSRCNVKESRQAKHDWEDWEYKPNSCEQERECKRCHQRDTKKAIHDWDEWNYQAQDSCEQERICNRCRKKETRQKTHTWSNWADTDIPLKQQRICRRCNAEEIRELREGPFQRYYGSGSCDVCNKSIGPGEAYSVPVSVFYSSRKYKEWLKTGPMSFMLQMIGGNVDLFISSMRANDPTSHSAVCSGCIHMFE
jgi:hypothetical protein